MRSRNGKVKRRWLQSVRQVESTGERCWDIRSRSSGGRRSRFVAVVVGGMLETHASGNCALFMDESPDMFRAFDSTRFFVWTLLNKHSGIEDIMRCLGRNKLQPGIV